MYGNVRAHTFNVSTSVYVDSAYPDTVHTVHTSPGYNQSTQTEPVSKLWRNLQGTAREVSEKMAFCRISEEQLEAVAQKTVWFDSGNYTGYLNIGTTYDMADGTNGTSFCINACTKSAALDTLTYKNKPGFLTVYRSLCENFSDGFQVVIVPSVLRGEKFQTTNNLRYLLENGMAFSMENASPAPSSGSPAAFDASGVIVPSRTAIGVYVADILLEAENLSPVAYSHAEPGEAIVVSWTVENPEFFFREKPTQASFALEYYTVSSDGTSATTTITGTTETAATIPASATTGANYVMWRVKLTSTDGIEGAWSSWVQVNCLDMSGKAKIVQPIGTAVDGTKNISFQWVHSSTNGVAGQASAELQKSTNGTTWTELATITGAETTWICLAGTLGSTVKYWRVRTKDTIGNTGDWSDVAQIVVIAAPSTPSVTVKSNDPRPSISWIAPEQVGYQVELDGAVIGGTNYGAVNTWKCPVYLADGTHAFRVRVQNQYGLWSGWGAETVDVKNTETTPISIRRVSIPAKRERVEIEWECEDIYDFYLVYRNGVPVAKTKEKTWNDYLALGDAAYFVRGGFSGNGNYGISQTVARRMTTGNFVHVYGIESDRSVILQHCGLRHQKLQSSMTRDIQYIFMAGHAYPYAERSEFLTEKISGSAVFLPGEDLSGFESLAGELVCIKTQAGERVIGYLNDLVETPTPLAGKTEVSFSVQQTGYVEGVDLDS